MLEDTPYGLHPRYGSSLQGVRGQVSPSIAWPCFLFFTDPLLSNAISYSDSLVYLCTVTQAHGSVKSSPELVLFSCGIPDP